MNEEAKVLKLMLNVFNNKPYLVYGYSQKDNSYKILGLRLQDGIVSIDVFISDIDREHSADNTIIVVSVKNEEEAISIGPMSIDKVIQVLEDNGIDYLLEGIA